MNDNPSSRICDELRREILSGRLVAGARLETERALAVRYGISSTTVNKIMTLLELEGLLERRRGSGTYVRPDLARRAAGVVLGPMLAAPGAVFWADLAHLAVESASKREGGARCYFAAGTAFMAETPLAADARAGRLSGALLLAAGDAAAAVLLDAGLPFVSLAANGPGPAVRIAWRESARDLVADMIRRGAWPLAVQLPPGLPGDEIAAGWREATVAAGLAVDEELLGRPGDADGPQGWSWAAKMMSRGARGLFLAGERPESALMALAAAGMKGGPAVAVWTIAGRTPAFGRSLARLELDPIEIVQAGFEMLGALERAGRESSAAAAVATVRTLRPRFIEGETLPRRPG
ncbi:MAG: GntR family transcriptional regulator [Planctomycetota bacterium]|nr:GntR family transcriptional regulator [Planctomycetota bacterium]